MTDKINKNQIEMYVSTISLMYERISLLKQLRVIEEGLYKKLVDSSMDYSISESYRLKQIDMYNTEILFDLERISRFKHKVRSMEGKNEFLKS